MKHIWTSIIAIIVLLPVVGVTTPVLAQYKKMLVVGNSITHHSPKESIYWYGDWGMAASCEDNDFAHRLLSKIQADQPETPLELQTARIDDEFNTMTGYSHLLNNDADLIIIELGDNYHGDLTYEALQIPFEAMIADLSAGGNNPEVLVVSTWWGTDPLKNTYLEAAAISQGVDFVRITSLSNTYANLAVSEDYCLDEWKPGEVGAGIGWHPGDRGMEAIASTIYDQVPERTPEPATLSILGLGMLWFLKRK